MTTWFHEQRLERVRDEVRAGRARTVLDLGCGEGDLLVRLAQEPDIERIVGLDICQAKLSRLAARLDAMSRRGPADIDLVHASMIDDSRRFSGFDCAVLLETIEHVDPDRLSALERAVFWRMRPSKVVITTPNAEFNPLLGVPRHRFRHPDHRFEWDRSKFRCWARGVAARNEYVARFDDIAGLHARYGGASQMATFESPHSGGAMRDACED